MSLSKRILIDSVFILLIPFMPWYVMAVAGLLLFWKWDLVEIIGFGLIMDIVYGSNLMGSSSSFLAGLYSHIASVRGLGWIPYLPFSYGAILAVWVLSLIKKRIR